VLNVNVVFAKTAEYSLSGIKLTVYECGLLYKSMW